MSYKIFKPTAKRMIGTIGILVGESLGKFLLVIAYGKLFIVVASPGMRPGWLPYVSIFSNWLLHLVIACGLVLYFRQGQKPTMDLRAIAIGFGALLIGEWVVLKTVKLLSSSVTEAALNIILIIGAALVAYLAASNVEKFLHLKTSK